MAGNTLSGFKLLTTQNFVTGCDPIKKEAFNIFGDSTDEQSNNNSNNNISNSDGSKKGDDSEYLFVKKKNYIDSGFCRRDSLSLDLIKENFRILSYKQPRNIEFIRSFFILKGVEKSEERDLTGN